MRGKRVQSEGKARRWSAEGARLEFLTRRTGSTGHWPVVPVEAGSAARIDELEQIRRGRKFRRGRAVVPVEARAVLPVVVPVLFR